MKKVLLLAAVAAVSAASASAVEQQVIENATINKLSPDGNMAVSDMYGAVEIIDFANDKRYLYGGEEYEGPACSLGNGNSVSSTGIVVGGIGESTPAYWENGEWKALPVGEAQGVYNVNGVTPDGSRMCGIVASNTTGETTILPAVWDRNEDGTYGNYKVLPYPTIDFTGRAPQYVTAIAISNDGKTVAGQVQDFAGMMPQPIVYRLNDKNEWEYELLHGELLNVSNTEFPEWQDAPKYPDPDEYMLENRAAYDAAYEEYVNSGYNYELCPNREDYMTDEEIAAWKKDADVYNAWVAWSNQFGELYWALGDAGAALFEFNNVFLSGNGRYFGTTATLIQDNGEDFPIEKSVPFIFDLTTGDYKSYISDADIAMTFVADNGDALAGTKLDFFSISPQQAYALRSGDDKFIPLIEYLANYPATVAWMKQNMSHDGVVTGVDENYNQIVENNYMITGMPTASADMSVIATWTTSDLWDLDRVGPAAYSYILVPGLELPAGITSPVAGEGLEISVVDGAVMVNGEATSVEVYDLNGRLVMSVANPGSKVETSLEAGYYIVKAVAANGETVTVKAAL